MIEFKRLFKYDLVVKFIDNGGIYVEAGCCKLYFDNLDDYFVTLKMAIDNPDEWEKAYFKHAGMTQTDQPVATGCV